MLWRVKGARILIREQSRGDPARVHLSTAGKPGGLPLHTPVATRTRMKRDDRLGNETDHEEIALPSEPGPPFRVGETVAFFPAEIGPTSVWLKWDLAVIDDIKEEAQSFGFHFVGEPGVRHGQGFE